MQEGFGKVLRPLAALGALGWMGVIFWLSAQPDLPSPVELPYGDKLSHFTAYGILSSLYLLSMRRSGGYTLGQVLLAAGLATLYGVSDEWHQSFVPGRSPDLWDVVADASGALAAAFFLRWLLSPRPSV